MSLEKSGHTPQDRGLVQDILSLTHLRTEDISPLVQALEDCCIPPELLETFHNAPPQSATLTLRASLNSIISAFNMRSMVDRVPGVTHEVVQRNMAGGLLGLGRILDVITRKTANPNLNTQPFSPWDLSEQEEAQLREHMVVTSTDADSGDFVHQIAHIALGKVRNLTTTTP